MAVVLVGMGMVSKHSGIPIDLLAECDEDLYHDIADRTMELLKKTGSLV